MSSMVINSDYTLQFVLGELREMYGTHRYVKVSAKTGKARSLDQNAMEKSNG